MLKRNEFEGKTKEEALAKACEHFGLDEQDLFIEEEFVSGKLFKSSKYILKVLSSKEILDYLKDYLKNLSKCMNIEWNQEVRFQDNSFQVVIVSENYNPSLIGKEGKTLDALQYIIRQTLMNQTGLPIHVNVDVANYKKSKIERLEYEVEKIAKDVLKTKVDASLDPMNSYERRAIHTHFQDWDNIKTESIGEGSLRHIIIKYIEK